MPDLVKLVVFVPESHADIVRGALGDAGAGTIGNYRSCSFSSKGYGRFIPMDGANPAIGAVGTLETVAEERIEVLCEREKLGHIMTAVRAVHPYEELAFDVYPLLNTQDL